MTKPIEPIYNQVILMIFETENAKEKTNDIKSIKDYKEKLFFLHELRRFIENYDQSYNFEQLKDLPKGY